MYKKPPCMSCTVSSIHHGIYHHDHCRMRLIARSPDESQAKWMKPRDIDEMATQVCGRPSLHPPILHMPACVYTYSCACIVLLYLVPVVCLDMLDVEVLLCEQHV